MLTLNQVSKRSLCKIIQTKAYFQNYFQLCNYIHTYKLNIYVYCRTVSLISCLKLSLRPRWLTFYTGVVDELLKVSVGIFIALKKTTQPHT